MSSIQKQGKALITGASTGIGAIYADRLAKRGYDLILVARDEAKLNGVADKIKADHAVNVTVISADLTLKEELARIESILRADSSITLLVNNAGLGAVTKLAESNIDDIETMISLNVIALTRLSAAITPGLITSGHGAIINIASIVALAPELLNGAYSGSKAYVVNFTQSMHLELADKGIRVQAVLPGAIDTPFWDKSGLPVNHLPAQIVMNPEALVDAALAGFDMGEVITIPSLPDLNDWHVLESARKALAPNLSHTTPASRYLS
ncbi:MULTISPECIES: SDR family oxidoreductase [unclassified Methylotenera]|uniref:SDR family NAD(P)-dependent oxidoreductase n=1 Tax=unclassified Methylotenera TaxID=2643294 RepID=UPI00036A9996|nr:MULTISPECIES: SDR family oxidoreductase [unclassified Methylotenera]